MKLDAAFSSPTSLLVLTTDARTNAPLQTKKLLDIIKLPFPQEHQCPEWGEIMYPLLQSVILLLVVGASDRSSRLPKLLKNDYHLVKVERPPDVSVSYAMHIYTMEMGFQYHYKLQAGGCLSRLLLSSLSGIHQEIKALKEVTLQVPKHGVHIIMIHCLITEGDYDCNKRDFFFCLLDVTQS